MHTIFNTMRVNAAVLFVCVAFFTGCGGQPESRGTTPTGELTAEREAEIQARQQEVMLEEQAHAESQH